MMPQGQSKGCLLSLLKMHGHGLNTENFCGVPLVGATTLSSAPEIFRETIAICWQQSHNSFYTILIMRKQRSITNDFSIFAQTCEIIL
jgi:hypothetical protein